MLENLIKGGLKPGMVLSSKEPEKTRYTAAENLYIVFPDYDNKLCYMKYIGGGIWNRINEYRFTEHFKAIYNCPRCGLSDSTRLIWTEKLGVVDYNFKLKTLPERLAEIDGREMPPKEEITNSKYFY